jgi:hypothetical protein
MTGRDPLSRLRSHPLQINVLRASVRRLSQLAIGSDIGRLPTQFHYFSVGFELALIWINGGSMELPFGTAQVCRSLFEVQG